VLQESHGTDKQTHSGIVQCKTASDKCHNHCVAKQSFSAGVRGLQGFCVLCLRHSRDSILLTRIRFLNTYTNLKSRSLAARKIITVVINIKCI
jgi:hypothetical protein